MGGAGSGVAEALAAAGITIPLLHLGLPDRFIDHGDPAQLLSDCGLDARRHRRRGQRALSGIARPHAVVKPAA